MCTIGIPHITKKNIQSNLYVLLYPSILILTEKSKVYLAYALYSTYSKSIMKYEVYLACS